MKAFYGCGQIKYTWYNKNMRKAKEVAGRKCQICDKTEHQRNCGKNRSETQRCFCTECRKYYAQPENTGIFRRITWTAIKTYYAGTSGWGVGKIFGFNKANVYNWIKKLRKIKLKFFINILKLMNCTGLKKEKELPKPVKIFI